MVLITPKIIMMDHSALTGPAFISVFMAGTAGVSGMQALFLPIIIPVELSISMASLLAVSLGSMSRLVVSSGASKAIYHGAILMAVRAGNRAGNRDREKKPQTS